MYGYHGETYIFSKFFTNKNVENVKRYLSCADVFGIKGSVCVALEGWNFQGLLLTYIGTYSENFSSLARAFGALYTKHLVKK